MHRPGKDLSWREFAKRLAAEYKKDRIGVQAAALTYYAMLALFPFLIFLVTFGGLLLNPQRIAALVQELGKAAPGEVVSIVGDRLHELQDKAGGGVLAIAILGALWAASSGMTSLMEALDLSLETPETRPYWKRRLIAIGVTVASGLLALVAALAMFGMPVLGKFIGGPVGVGVSLSRFVLAGLLMVLFVAILYHFLPNVRSRFRVLSVGALVAVPLWLLASWAFGQYVSHFGKYGAVYGALGGVVVLLIWMWISAQVILLGAEMNKVLTPRGELQPAQAGERLPARGRAVPRVPEPQPT
jgi:membrane protein